MAAFSVRHMSPRARAAIRQHQRDATHQARVWLTAELSQQMLEHANDFLSKVTFARPAREYDPVFSWRGAQ